MANRTLSLWYLIFSKEDNKIWILNLFSPFLCVTIFNLLLASRNQESLLVTLQALLIFHLEFSEISKAKCLSGKYLFKRKSVWQRPKKCIIKYLHRKSRKTQAEPVLPWQEFTIWLHQPTKSNSILMSVASLYNFNLLFVKDGFPGGLVIRTDCYK